MYAATSADSGPFNSTVEPTLQKKTVLIYKSYFVRQIKGEKLFAQPRSESEEWKLLQNYATKLYENINRLKLVLGWYPKQMRIAFIYLCYCEKKPFNTRDISKISIHGRFEVCRCTFKICSGLRLVMVPTILTCLVLKAG